MLQTEEGDTTLREAHQTRGTQDRLGSPLNLTEISQDPWEFPNLIEKTQNPLGVTYSVWGHSITWKGIT